MLGSSSVRCVGFSLAGDEENRRASHAEVTTFELNDSATGNPVPHGVHDLRLGTTDHGWLCLTCAQGKKLCPGHPGHMELRAAVFSPVAVAEVRRWLRVACLQCGALVVEPERYAGARPGRRLQAAAAAAVDQAPCPRCRAPHPKILKDPEDHFSFLAAGGREGEAPPVRLAPDAVRAALARVSEEDVAAMGRGGWAAHPRRLTLRAVPVPPNTIRPGVKNFGGAGSSYHDITSLLQYLAKRNLHLPEALGEALARGEAPGPELARMLQTFHQLYWELVRGSSATNATQGSGGRRGLVIASRAPHSILQGLPKKVGRVRGNLLGTRVTEISRSTISGNSDLPVDAVGVPLEIARTLTVAVTATERSLGALAEFFANGPHVYPGATHVLRRATGELHDVGRLRGGALEVGDVLYRNLVDGDVAFFNRAPTLERSGIGAHRVVVVRNPAISTFQLNVAACKFYNADFDGDAMTLWAARGPAARAEALVLSAVHNNFISTKTSGPVNGQIEDSTVGCHALTRGATRLGKRQAMALFAATGLPPPRFDGRPPGALWEGREVVSLLFAAHAPVDYRGAPTSFSAVYAPFLAYPPGDTFTVMERGRLVAGVLDKKAVGAGSAGGLFHLVAREHGPQRALDMVYAVQRLALAFLLGEGFTSDTADTTAPPEGRRAIAGMVAATLAEGEAVAARLLRREVVPPLGSTTRQHFEGLMQAALALPEAEIMRAVLQGLRPASNGFFRMVSTGSKGSNPNFVNIAGAIGQTEIEGERLPPGPYFPRFSLDPRANGFVASCFMSGMSPSEFIAQAMKGRFDLITKALTTATSGYFMRKGVMSLQSSVVDVFRRVARGGRVVAMLYGDGGFDPRALEAVPLAFAAASDAALAAECPAGAFPPGSPGAAATAAAAAALAADRAEFRARFGRLAAAAPAAAPFPAALLLPVNVARVVEGVLLASAGAPPPPPDPLGAALAAKAARVADLCARLPYAYANELAERRRAPLPPHFAAAAALTAALVRAALTPRRLAGVTEGQLDAVVEAVRARYAAALVDYGTAVGVQAAQCTSEPLTQFLLNSHKRDATAGSSSRNKLARFAEIFGARGVGAEEGASMTLALRGLPEGDPPAAAAAAAAVAAALELVTVRQFVARYDVLLEAPGALLAPEGAADAGWLAEFARAHPLIARPPADLSNWCVRLAVDKGALALKAVSLEALVRRLRAAHPLLFVAHTPEAAPAVVIRAWARAPLLRRGGADRAERAEAIAAEVLATPVRGVPGVLTAAVRRLPAAAPAPDGSLARAERLFVVTSGTNLAGAALHPAVDPAGLASSSVGDTLEVFGIEAAYAKIISETRLFMESSTPGLGHLGVYAALMTSTGTLTSVERGGLAAREPANVLLRAANAAPVQAFTEAAVAGARAPVYGLAAPHLLGATPRVGSFFSRLAVDEGFVRANAASLDAALDAL